jgi:predicted Zn-dependent protease
VCGGWRLPCPCVRGRTFRRPGRPLVARRRAHSMADADKLLAEQYSTLVAKLNEEELEDAEEIVDALMSEVGESEELLRTRALLLIKNEDFEDAIEMIGAHPELGMGLERAYALYSLKREAEALEAIAELEQSVSAQQLHAQTLYRTGDYDGASRIYEALRRGGADGSDFSANCLAAFSVSSRKAEGLGMFRDVSADTFEGVYNGACVQINGGEYDEARNTLLAALKMGKEQLEMEGYEEDEIAADSDLLAVKVQLAYVDQVQGRAAEAMEAYADVIQQKPSDAAAVLAVARNNVVACKGERDLFDGFKHMRAATAAEGKLNRRQQKAVGANHALVLLLMGKNKECREAIDALSKKFPNDESVAVMYAALAYRQKSYKKCEDLLKKTTTPRASAASEPPDRTMQFLTLTQFYINQRRFPEAAATLASIAELRHQPAAVRETGAPLS